MSWYYTDWSWTQRLTTAAVVVVACGMILWSIIDAARATRAAHRGNVVTADELEQRTALEVDRADRFHATRHQNGERAA